MLSLANPYTLTLTAGILRFLWLRYPDYRDIIDALAVGLGLGSFGPVLSGTVKRLNGDGKASNSPSNSSSDTGSAAR